MLNLRKLELSYQEDGYLDVVFKRGTSASYLVSINQEGWLHMNNAVGIPGVQLNRGQRMKIGADMSRKPSAILTKKKPVKKKK